MAERTLTVKIIGDEDDLLRAFRASQSGAQRLSASFGTFVKGTLVFEGVRAAIDGISAAVRAGVSEFSESQKVVAQTNAALASTQGVANVTAREVGQLATQLSRMSGIDDELVQRGENLLLTFKQIRNEVGAGNDIFNRATKAALDLSVAGFGSLESTSKQLGKALNDPVRGLTALGRAGVTFTKAQRDQVKALVESGKFLEAQKVILREVESQVTGSAKAFGDTIPGELSKFREAFRNAFGDLVGIVAEPLARALGAFADFLPEIESGVARLSSAVGPALSGLVDTFVRRLPELQRIAGAILDPLRERALPVLSEFASVARDVFDKVVATFSSRSGQLRQILDNLGQILANVWTIARPTIVFLFEKVLPTAINIAIPILEKVTGVVRVMSEIWVQSVRVIIAAIDKFLGGLSGIADAASHIPFIGDHFAGVSDKINGVRESLRGFSDDLNALDGRRVDVEIAVNAVGAPSARAREGTVPQTGKDKVEEETKKAVAVADAQRDGARRVAAASNKATTTTKVALTAAERQRKAFDNLMEQLELRSERARGTPGINDDLVALRKQENAIKEQIRVEGRTVELERRLLDLNRERQQLRQQQRRGSQFQALGRTTEGDERVAGVDALKHRLGSLQQQIKGTVLDTSVTRRKLDAIGKVLKGKFGAVGREVRQAILDMFNQISGALNEGGAKVGPLTKTSGLNTKKIIEDLGLTPDQAREIRGRLSGFNTAGRALPGGQNRPTGGGFVGSGVVVENHVTVAIDGQKISSTVTKQQQKTRRRNPQQKRGPNRVR